MAEEKPTQEERENAREVALQNLKSPLVDLATSFYVNKGKQYGDAGNSAVEQFLYQPTLDSGATCYDPKTGEEVSLLRNGILGSRDDGELYSGKIDEKQIIKTAYEILQQSLGSVTVQDVLNLMGNKTEVGAEFKDAYISDLSQSKDEKVKKFVGSLMGAYQTWITDLKVSEALGKRAGTVNGGLEKRLSSSE